MRIPDGDEVYETCPECRGSRRFGKGDCPHCDGTGQVPVKPPIKTQSEEKIYPAEYGRRLAEQGIGRIERKQFLKATEPLTAVRDVNEHGFDGDGSVKPAMHRQEDGMLDETSLVVDGRRKILMGPLNLYDVYLAVDRMRKLAGFNALQENKKAASPPGGA